MRASVSLSLLLAAGPLWAAPVTLLTCNIPFGPDQQVQVVLDGGRLQLLELTGGGRTVSRELSEEEWNSRTLRLREQNGFRTLLTLETDGQASVHTTDGFGYNEYGPADCE